MDIKSLKERITGGLIVWLLVTIFIQPILRFTWKAIVVVGGLVHQGYVDEIYRKAATGAFVDFGLLTVMALFLSAPLILVFFFVREMKKLDQSHILTRISNAIWKLTVAVSFLVLVVLFTISIGTTRITASFTQRLTVLAPAISETEYKTLRARWASMEPKADYDALVTAMDKRANELGVKLPPVRNP